MVGVIHEHGNFPLSQIKQGQVISDRADRDGSNEGLSQVKWGEGEARCRYVSYTWSYIAAKRRHPAGYYVSM